MQTMEFLMWEAAEKCGFEVPSRAHPLSGRFDRARAKDKDLKSNVISSEGNIIGFLLPRCFSLIKR